MMVIYFAVLRLRCCAVVAVPWPVAGSIEDSVGFVERSRGEEQSVGRPGRFAIAELQGPELIDAQLQLGFVRHHRKEVVRWVGIEDHHRAAAEISDEKVGLSI